MNRWVIVFRSPGFADPAVKISVCFWIFASTFWPRQTPSYSEMTSLQRHRDRSAARLAALRACPEREPNGAGSSAVTKTSCPLDNRKDYVSRKDAKIAKGNRRVRLGLLCVLGVLARGNLGSGRRPGWENLCNLRLSNSFRSGHLQPVSSQSLPRKQAVATLQCRDNPQLVAGDGLAPAPCPPW